MHPLLKQDEFSQLRGSLNIRSSSEGREETGSAQRLYTKIKSPSCWGTAVTVPAWDLPAPGDSPGDTGPTSRTWSCHTGLHPHPSKGLRGQPTPSAPGSWPGEHGSKSHIQLWCRLMPAGATGQRLGSTARAGTLLVTHQARQQAVSQPRSARGRARRGRILPRRGRIAGMLSSFAGQD